MRILHAPQNYADQAGSVVRALRALGHDAEYWEYGESRFGFEADRRIDVSSGDPKILWQTFLEAKDRFDVFHFHFANSFFPYHWAVVPPYWDLPALRMLGKKVFFTFHGSDCRIRKIAEEKNPYAAEFFADTTPDDDRLQKSINVIKTYANKMFAVSVELLFYVPEAKPIPRAIDLSRWPEQPAVQRKVPRIAHFPSRRSFKGTARIVEGMEQLRREGIAFDFQLLEDIPNEKLKGVLRETDVLVDNVLMGDFGVASIEAMACNRVAVAWLSEPVRRANSGIPVYEVTPETFVDQLRILIEDVGLRKRLAQVGRQYVADHFDSVHAAREYVQAYEQEWPALTPRIFPDWMGFADSRRLEGMADRIAELGSERARMRDELSQTTGDLTRTKAALERELSKPWTPKDMLPPSIRARLKKLRAQLRGSKGDVSR
jgi:glycosyltransferase involved in cell wall biosynthesis